MLGQRRRQCTNIIMTLVECLRYAYMHLITHCVAYHFTWRDAGTKRVRLDLAHNVAEV